MRVLFCKKIEGTDVLETKIKISKTQKETGREYIFSETLQTIKVRFYEYDPYTDVKKILVKVPIDKIVKNKYSLNYAEYMKDSIKDEQYGKNIIEKTLGEICNFKNGKGIKKDALIDGDYPVIGGGKQPIGYHNEYNTDENTILCSSSGSAGFISRYDVKVWASDCFSIIPKDNTINNTYLYYLLKTIQDKIYKLQTGMAQPHVYSKDLQNIKIPIPSPEHQEGIVEYLDMIYEKANKMSNKKIAGLKRLNEYCLNNQKLLSGNVVKTLGEMCDFKNGKGIKKDALIEGIYPVIGGGKKPMGLHNKYNTDENTILCSSSGAYAGFISKYDSKVWASDCFSIIPKDDTINIDVDNTYLYYALKTIQDEIYKLQTGMAQPHVYYKDLQDIKMLIPSLKHQKEIVEYCEYNDVLTKQLEGEIENNIKQARQFIMSIIEQPAQTEE